MTVFRSDSSTIRLPRQLKNLFEALFLSGDLVSIVIAIVLLMMPAMALQAADWPLTLEIVMPSLATSILFGYFLARSRYNEIFSLLVSGLYGVVAVVMIGAINQSNNPVQGVELLMARSLQWAYDAATGGINQDNLVFSLIISILFWFFGYNATWHIFRLDRVWRVIIPPGLILIVNMVVYSGESNLDLYLLVYVFMSLLLIVRSNLEAREWDWYVHGVYAPKRLRQQFLLVGAMISLVALLAAWAIPSHDLQERLDNFQRFLTSQPIRRLSEFWNRLVEPIEANGPATADYYGGDSLNLGGAIRLGDQVVMLVEAPTDLRYYWRSRVFERYSEGRWSPSATRRVPDLSPPLEIIQPIDGLNGRQEVLQTFTMSIGTRLIYSAPQPLSVNLAGRIDLLRTDGDQDNPDSPMNVSVIRPRKVVERGMSYETTSNMSIASAHDLRSASMIYPEWVLNPNTYAGGVSSRVSGLARQIVSDADAINPYDQAKAIELWLRSNITYNESIPAPPPGVDPVEWLLFDIQQGYCTYYATSMIAMLRSLGIPARMAAGFAEGEYDAQLGQYVVRERDAHTWVEVYFPGYGWVEFEPTSAQAPINRDGDQEQPQQNPVAPVATAEPTQTPTPIPSPSPASSPTPDDAEQPPEGSDTEPTVTVTSSPTPTVTPVIVPTVAPPVQPPAPPQSGLLSFLLPALGIAALIMLSMIAFVLFLVFMWWWWEIRGMSGLSPVSRAYARMERYLVLIGLRSPEHYTPEERRRRIIRKLPQAERPITAITRMYMSERYSNQDHEGTAEGARNTQIANRAWRHTRKEVLLRWFKNRIPWLKE